MYFTIHITLNWYTSCNGIGFFQEDFVDYFKDKAAEKRRKLEDSEEEQKFNNDAKDLVNKNWKFIFKSRTTLYTPLMCNI